MDKKKKYYGEREGYLLCEPEKECIMCEDTAFWIAPETKELLCDRCRINNDEARFKR